MLKKVFIVFGLCLLLVGAAAGQEPQTLVKQANQAYEEKNYAECGKLYVAAFDKGVKSSGAFYDAACCLALSGQKDPAFTYLDKAFEGGWRNLKHLESDSDLNGLHEDARWKAAVEKCRKNREAYLKTINGELAQITEADQADRTTDKIDWEVVSKRDAARLKRVKEIVEAKELKAAEDYFNAALVLQHGSGPADYEMAHNLSKKAAELKPDFGTARWLSCAAKDRWLWSVGKPQVYGTQFKQDKDQNWTLEPFDKTAVTDEERKAWNVPTIAETMKRLDTMNKTK